MQIVHIYITNWCTWLAHTLCKGLIWNYKNCWAQPWLSFGILQALWWSWECIRYFFFLDWYRILLWNFEICPISLCNFGWWYTLMKNKHQISLYLSLKMANVLQITFSNGFSFKKLLSFCLSLSVSLYVCLSVPATPFYPSALRAGGVLSSRFGWSVGRAAAKLAEPISL